MKITPGILRFEAEEQVYSDVHARRVMRAAADRLGTLEALLTGIAERGPTVGYACAWCGGMPADTRPDEAVWAVKDHDAACLWRRVVRAVRP